MVREEAPLEKTVFAAEHLAGVDSFFMIRAYETPYEPLLWIFAVFMLFFDFVVAMAWPWPGHGPNKSKKRLKTAKIQSMG